MKKCISIILCLVMVLSIFTVVPFTANAVVTDLAETGATSGTTGDCTWTLNGTELTISGNGKVDNGQPWGSNITKVTIEDGVTSISRLAFYNCDRLTSVTIPDSVTCIAENAFLFCANLTSVYIKDIGSWCAIDFASNLSNPLCYAHNLYLNGELVKDLVIPDSVTTIGSYAFYNCSSLTSVTIPDSVKSIGDSAFSGCSSLTAVNIEDIGAWCAIDFDSNPLYYAHNLYLNGELVKELIIPDSVTSIGDSAFSGCSSLTSVTIPDSVTNIDAAAFYKCSRLTSVTIPDSVTSIGEGAFSGCSSLTSVTIPDLVTTIGDYAFYNCGSLTSVTIPDSVTSIGEGAFSGCSSLTSVTIPDSVTSIYYYTFCNCSRLTSVTIPESVTTIGNYAFYDCRSLTSVTIPESVSTIGYEAFLGCNSLTSVFIKDIGAWCAIDFGSYSSNPLYYANNLYLNGELVKDLVIPDSVTAIGESAFFRCDSLTSLTIPDSVRTISADAFYRCSNLTSVAIGNSVRTIGEDAFLGCSSLTSVMIPDSVTSIGESAFGYYIPDDELGTEKVKGFTIKGLKGSNAEKYAKDNGFTFITVTEIPTEPPVKIVLGDADDDGDLTVMDATRIQRWLAELCNMNGSAYTGAKLSDNQIKAADADEDSEVTILDATAIQRHLADLPTNANIGKQIT